MFQSAKTRLHGCTYSTAIKPDGVKESCYLQAILGSLKDMVNPDFYTQHASLLSTFRASVIRLLLLYYYIVVTDSHLTPRRSAWYLGGRAEPRLR